MGLDCIESDAIRFSSRFLLPNVSPSNHHLKVTGLHSLPFHFVLSSLLVMFLQRSSTGGGV